MKRLIIIIFGLTLLVSCSSYQKRKNNEVISAVEKLTNTLKKQYIEYNSKNSKKKLAVLPFVNENSDISQLGIYIFNYIQLKIFNPKVFTLLERQRIGSLLSEHEFNNSGLVKDIDSKKLGELLGAELVLVGSISLNEIDNEQFFSITGRIVDLESGEIGSISSVDLKAAAELVKKYNTIIKKKIKNISGTYEIRISDISIARKKEDGRNWDTFSGPDIIIYIRTRLTNIIRSKIYFDQWKIDGEIFQGNIILGEKDYIDIKVIEKDNIENDLIGTSILIKEQILDILNNKKRIILKFDQVDSLSVELKKLEL